jgi:hypothetical protein
MLQADGSIIPTDLTSWCGQGAVNLQEDDRMQINASTETASYVQINAQNSIVPAHYNRKKFQNQRQGAIRSPEARWDTTKRKRKDVWKWIPAHLGLFVIHKQLENVIYN